MLRGAGTRGHCTCDRAAFTKLFAKNSLLDGHFLRELLHRVVSLEFFHFWWSVLVEELVDRKVAATNTDVDLVFVHTHCHALGSELVDTLRLSHEHDLQLLSVWVVVDVFGQSLVNLVVLHRDVHCNAALEINDVLLKSLDLLVKHFDLVEKFFILEFDLLQLLEQFK